MDRLFARDDGAQNSDVFGSAFLLVILNVALSMTAAILAMNAGAMRIAGFEMVATVAAAILALAFLLSWLVEERPLRQSVDTAGVGEAFAAPSDGDSLHELTRELARLVGRERT